MKKKALIFSIGFCFGFFVIWEVQAEEYSIKVTPADVDLISDGLQTQPFGKVFPLMNKLRSQIIEQQQAAQKPAADPPKEPAK